MKEIRLFEAFAGVGSQHKAMSNLEKKNKDKFKLKSVGICEWDANAVISYFSMNGYKLSGRNYDINTLKKYLMTRGYSRDGHNIATSLSGFTDTQIKLLFESDSILNNFPNIFNLKGKDIAELDVDVFTYSFPCQDLSNAGKGKGMKKGENTRSGLLWEVERILHEIEEENISKLPRFLLLENVPQILSKNNIDDYKLWESELSRLGYTTFSGVLNSLDFGIPQSRKRFFAVSILNYEGNTKEKDISKIIDDKYNEKIKKTRLKSKLRLDYEKDDKYLEEALKSTPNHTPSRLKMMDVEKKLTKEECFDNAYKVQTNGSKCFVNTLTTKQDRWGNAGMIHFRHKVFENNERSKMRYITPREAFLLMDFDEKSVEKVLSNDLGNISYYKQAGNSIVVKVLEVIFDTFIINEIDE